MAVYTPGRKTYRWAAPAAALLVLGVIVLASLWLVRASRPGPEARVADAADQMSSQLDVLRLSLYTTETVRNGQVVGQQEYDAALEALSQVRSEWEGVRTLVEPRQAEAIGRGLDQLQSLVEGKRPASEVNQLSQILIEQIRSMTVRR